MSEAVWRKGRLDARRPPGGSARAVQAWTLAFERRAPYEANYRLLCADGQYRWMSSRAVPLFNADQTVREWIGLILDMTGSAVAMGQPTHATLENLTAPWCEAGGRC